jgi:hypothetical protein
VWDDDVVPLTVIVLVLDREPSFAVMVAIPFRRPVTTPDVDTFAIVASLDAKVAWGPNAAVRSAPVADLTAPLNWSVDPTASVAVAGDSVILLAAVVDTLVPTVMMLVLDREPSFAVMVAIPFRRPVTTPDVDTFTIVVSLDAKVAWGPNAAVRSVPVTDLMAPLNWSVAPTASVVVAGEIVILLATDADELFAASVRPDASSPGRVTSLLEQAVATASRDNVMKKRLLYTIKPSRRTIR